MTKAPRGDALRRDDTDAPILWLTDICPITGPDVVALSGVVRSNSDVGNNK